MPTTKPRITLTLSDHQHEVLQGLSELQGQSMSSIIVELLDTSMPVLERLQSILSAAAAAPQEVLEQLKLSLEGAEANFVGKQGEVMHQFDQLVAAVGGGDGSALSRTPAPTTQAASTDRKKARPPSTNRGVRKTTKSPKSPSRTGVSVNSTRSKKA
jgi:hypothetical protein